MSEQKWPLRKGTLAWLLLRDVVASALALSAFFAAESWQQAQPGTISTSVSVLVAFVAAFYLTGLVHEWGHYIGGRLARAPMTLLPPSKFPALYRFDYQASDSRQFDWMSWGGNLASAALVLLLLGVWPANSIAVIAFLSTALFFCLFTGGLESFAIRSSMRGEAPSEAIKAIPGDYLRRCAPPAAAAALALFALLYTRLPATLA